MGIALLCFVAYPLFRYVGPSSSWALPLILMGGIASGIVVWQDYRRSASDYAVVREPRNLLRNALYLLLVFIGLTAPSSVEGLEYLGSQYVGAYPSVFFWPASMADSTRLVDWGTLADAALSGRLDSEATKAVCALDPTAIYTTNYLLNPLAHYTHAVVLGAMSALSELPALSVFHPLCLTGFLALIPVSIVLGHRLGMPVWASYLFSAALALGQWSLVLQEYHSIVTMIALPVSLLFFFGLVESESNPQPLVTRQRLLAAVVGAAFIAAYIRFAGFIGAGVALYLALTLLTQRQRWLTLRNNFFVGALIGAALFVSGQLFPIADCFVASAKEATTFLARDSFIANLVWKHPVVAFSGLLGTWQRFFAPDASASLVSIMVQLIAAMIAVMWVWSVIGLVRGWKQPANRLLLSILAVTIVQAGLFSLRAQHYPFAKVVFYSYTFFLLPLGLAVSAHQAEFFHDPRIRKYLGMASAVILVVWACSQFLNTVHACHLARKNGGYTFPAARRATPKMDLSAITDKLRSTNVPKLLLVDIPPSKEDGWSFAWYCVFVFKEFPAHFKSGIHHMWDGAKGNFTTACLRETTEVPDYAVVRRTVDDIGPHHRGEKIAETADLILYRLDQSKFVDSSRNGSKAP